MELIKFILRNHILEEKKICELHKSYKKITKNSPNSKVKIHQSRQKSPNTPLVSMINWDWKSDSAHKCFPPIHFTDMVEYNRAK